MSSVVCWDKPKKVSSTKEHNEKHSSDSGVAGTYVPNMSKEDMLKWKGTLKAKNTDHPFVELRKTFSRDGQYSQALVIVAHNGYTYKHDKPENSRSTNVRISLNGPAALTFDELEDMNWAIKEARTYLLLGE
jgi:hypothetical protein